MVQATMNDVQKHIVPVIYQHRELNQAQTSLIFLSFLSQTLHLILETMHWASSFGYTQQYRELNEAYNDNVFLCFLS